MCKHRFSLALIAMLPLLIVVSCSPVSDQFNWSGDRTSEADYDENMLPLTLYFHNVDYDSARSDSEALIPVTRNIPHTEAIARATVTELFRGPSPRESGRFNAAPVVDREISIEDIYIQGGICVIHLDYEGTLFDSTAAGLADSAEIFMQSLVRTLTAHPPINAVWVFHNGAPWQGEIEWCCPLTAPGGSVQYTVYFKETGEFDPGVPGRAGILKPDLVEVTPGSDLHDCSFSLIIELLSTGLDQQRGAALPRSSVALGFTLADGILTVDLGGRLPQGHQDVLLMMRSLVYTFTGLPEVDRLLVTLNGDPWSDGHVAWDVPLGRADLP